MLQRWWQWDLGIDRPRTLCLPLCTWIIWSLFWRIGLGTMSKFGGALLPTCSQYKWRSDGSIPFPFPFPTAGLCRKGGFRVSLFIFSPLTWETSHLKLVCALARSSSLTEAEWGSERGWGQTPLCPCFAGASVWMGIHMDIHSLEDLGFCPNLVPLLPCTWSNLSYVTIKVFMRQSLFL